MIFSICICSSCRCQAGRNRRRKRMVRAQKRIKLGFLISPWKGRERSKHIENLYVDPPQNATLLLPPTSTGFYADGNSPRKTLENSGKQNPKMGFKSPPEHIVRIPVTLSGLNSITYEISIFIKIKIK